MTKTWGDYGFTRDEYLAWSKHGFLPFEAAAWRDMGYQPREAAAVVMVEMIDDDTCFDY